MILKSQMSNLKSDISNGSMTNPEYTKKRLASRLLKEELDSRFKTENKFVNKNPESNTYYEIGSDNDRRSQSPKNIKISNTFGTDKDTYYKQNFGNYKSSDDDLANKETDFIPKPTVRYPGTGSSNKIYSKHLSKNKSDVTFEQDKSHQILLMERNRELMIGSKTLN